MENKKYKEYLRVAITKSDLSRIAKKKKHVIHFLYNFELTGPSRRPFPHELSKPAFFFLLLAGLCYGDGKMSVASGHCPPGGYHGHRPAQVFA